MKISGLSCETKKIFLVFLGHPSVYCTAYCGHNAQCDEGAGQCVCKEKYSGDPYKRCFPNIGKIFIPSCC